MDLHAVRTFVAVAAEGQFQAAADELGITQQAASKRIGTLERELGVKLFTRSPRGVRLTVDGQAFLPHARDLLAAEERALDSVLPGRRALRVDVLNRRIAPATLLRTYYQLHPEIDLDVVTLSDASAEAALAAVSDGTVDVTFRALRSKKRQLAGTSLRAERVISNRHQLLVGPRHPLAAARTVTMSELANQPIWMPGLPADTEQSAYYDDLADTFGLTIDVLGPNFGAEALLDEIAASTTRVTFIGETDRYVWPASHDLRRIAVVDPIPVYPLSAVWREDNPHPALGPFLDYLREAHASQDHRAEWQPHWAE